MSSKASLSSKASPAENMLKKLRKLDSNMACPNCGTQAQVGVGFGNVCVKFRTFICDMCKTSHQAISHRVKSVSMSHWTMDEVNELLDCNGGGNRAALHVWLQGAPPVGGRYPGGTRPRPGDRVEVFKQFVLDAYEHGKFRASTPYTPSAAAMAMESSVSSKSASASAPASAKISPAPSPAVALYAQTAPSPVPSSFAAAPAPAAAAVNLLDDDFFAPSPSLSAPAATTAAADPFAAPANGFDPFAAAPAAPSPVPVSVFTAAQPAIAPPAKAFVSPSPAVPANPFAAPPHAQTQNNSVFSSSVPVESRGSSATQSGFDFFNNTAAHTQTHTQTQTPSAPSLQVPQAFDPFGDTLLMPTPSASASPHSPFAHSQTHTPTTTQTQPQTQTQSSSAAILGLYASNGVGGGNAVMHAGLRNNAMAASAISQIDVFAPQTHTQTQFRGAAPMPAMGMMANASMPLYAPPQRPFMSTQPMQPMQFPQHRQGQGQQQGQASFDFVRESMQSMQQNAQANSAMRTAPPNPFR